MWTIQDYVTIHLLLDSDEQYLHIQYSKMIHELDIHSLAVSNSHDSVLFWFSNDNSYQNRSSDSRDTR